MKQIIPINVLRGGVAPCVTAHYYKAGGRNFYPDNVFCPHIAILEIEIMEETKPIQVAQIYDKEKNPINGRVYSADGIAPTLLTPTGGLSEPKILEPICCAIRGRNICAGTPTEQNLELGGDVTNCLTSVQKDSMVVEPVILTKTRTEKAKELRRQGIDTFRGRQMVPRTDDVANTITTVTHDNLVLTYEKRKEPIRIGDVYGRLTVLSKMNKKQGSNYMYLCRWATYSQQLRNRSIWGEIPYEGIVKDSTGYRAQIMVNGQKVYIAHSVSDIEFLVNARNEYIKTHKLPHRLQEYNKDNLLQEPCIIGYSRDQKGNVQNYNERDVAGTLHASTGNGGNTDQFVKEMVIGSMQANAMHGSLDGVSPCLTEAMGTGGGQIPMVTIRYRIRKLTERECFRLMGMDDADIDKIDAYRIKTTLKDGNVKEKPIPKTQKYKMAGNSIVVDVLYYIFYQMFIAELPKPQPRQLTLFDL